LCLKARLKHSTEWEEFPGSCRVRSILRGMGNMDEFTIEAPVGRIEAVTVRLYSPANGEWSIYWVAHPGSGGRFDVPLVGRLLMLARLVPSRANLLCPWSPCQFSVLMRRCWR
jgi:hypothetical protein